MTRSWKIKRKKVRINTKTHIFVILYQKAWTYTRPCPYWIEICKYSSIEGKYWRANNVFVFICLTCISKWQNTINNADSSEPVTRPDIAATKSLLELPTVSENNKIEVSQQNPNSWWHNIPCWKDQYPQIKLTQQCSQTQKLLCSQKTKFLR